MTTKLIAIALTMLFLVGCGSDNEETADVPGESATYERIESLTDCSELQAEFDVFMAVFDSNEPGTDRATAAVAYASAADDRMIDLDC